MKTMNSSKKASASKTFRTSDEQQLWDNVVLNLIQQGKPGTTAAKQANLVIVARRAS